MKVEKATEADLADILHWLEREHEQNGEGFWCNRGVISRSLDEDDLWVIRENGQVVAFQVGTYAADIANVRQDKQRQGFGTALAEASLARAERDGVNVLAGECCPRSSLPFWQKHGFERYGDVSEGAPVRVRRVLVRTFTLPPDLPQVAVAIDFYPEAALYGAGVEPVAVHSVNGARRADGTVLLERRVIGLSDGETQRGDLVVRVVIDGSERCFGKAKHEEARQAGVVRDARGSCFYIDAVSPPAD